MSEIIKDKSGLMRALIQASNEVYRRTVRSPANWVRHTHGPEDRPETCMVCKTLGITQEDWDRPTEDDQH